MVIDATAIVAILMGEPEAEQFAKAIANDEMRLICSASAMQACITIEAKKGEEGGRECDLLLLKAQIKIIPFDQGQFLMARRLWKKYGKGRHQVGLTMNDCCSYALAKSVGEPLLHKSDGLRMLSETEDDHPFYPDA